MSKSSRKGFNFGLILFSYVLLVVALFKGGNTITSVYTDELIKGTIKDQINRNFDQEVATELLDFNNKENMAISHIALIQGFSTTLGGAITLEFFLSFLASLRDKK